MVAILEPELEAEIDAYERYRATITKYTIGAGDEQDTLTKLIAMLAETPQFKFLTRLMEEHEAEHGSGQSPPAPAKFTARHGGATVARYTEQQLHDEALAVHSQGLRDGKSLSYDECAARAVANLGGRTGPSVQRYTLIDPPGHDAIMARTQALLKQSAGQVATVESYEQRLSEEAIKVHGEALKQGKVLDFPTCEAEAARRIRR